MKWLNKTKKLWLLLLTSFLYTYSLAQVKVLVTPAENVVTVSVAFTIEVKVESGSQQIDGANIFLSFDPTLVQVVSASAGTSLGVPLSSVSFNNTTGIISYAYGTFSNFPSGSFTLFSAQLRPIANGSSSLSFVPKNGIATDLSFRSSSVLEQKVNGQVRSGGITGMLICAGCAEEAVTAYPNPASGKFRLYSKYKKGQGIVTITKPNGMVVSTTPVDLAQEQPVEVDISEQANGLYIIRLETGNSSSFTKLIKY